MAELTPGEKFKYLDIAHSLHYKKKYIDKLSKATTEEEAIRIMIDARKNSQKGDGYMYVDPFLFGLGVGIIVGMVAITLIAYFYTRRK